MIKTLVVDDEMPARNELKRFLKGEPDFAVLGEASDGETALAEVMRLKPQVVFLDIHMPKRTGLEVAASLAETDLPPVVVFVTAYDEHALEAFEVNAIDYVLKPFDRERFKKTCMKIRRALSDQKEAKKRLTDLSQYLVQKKFPSLVGHKRQSKDRVFIHPRDVYYFHAKLTEVTALMRDHSELIVNATLKTLVEMLESAHFQQSHRAYIVNLNEVARVTPVINGNFEMTLKDSAQTRLPLSRRYAKKLRKLIRW
jgi:DNA-binding LytR/AlgR family response regulator